MPMQRSVLSKYVAHNFVETGTYAGEAVAMAVSLGFKEIYTIDCNEPYVRRCEAANAGNTHVRCFLGDSGDWLRKVLLDINGDCTLWCDAHPLETPMPFFSIRFPLLRELLSIKRSLKPGKHTLLIDDLRTFNAEDLKALRACVAGLWPGAPISTEPGIQDNDILCVRISQ